MSDNLTPEIKQHIGVLAENARTGWKKELCVVSWGGKPSKLEIRSWNEDYSKCSKGISFTNEEVAELKRLLNETTII